MTGNIAQLFDPGALAIVLSGTALATAARCGWSDLCAAAGAFARLGRSGFDENANCIALARTATTIERDGPLCADIPMPPDPSLAHMVSAYLRHASLDGFHHVRRAERTAREIARGRAIRTFEYAGELAPVFGLVGTLLAIMQMVPGSEGGGSSTLEAIGTAVLSTLYGVLTAHMICMPLAQAIERKGAREERAREELADWLDRQLRSESGSVVPHMRDVA